MPNIKNVTKDILIFSDEIPPSGGGTGVIAKKLVENYHSQGVEVTLLSGDEGDCSALVKQHIKVKRATVIWVITYALALLFKVKLKTFSRIILNDQMAAYLAGLLFSKKHLEKCVVIIHGRDANFFFKRQSKKHRFFFLKKFYQRTITHCQSLVAVSNWTQQEYMDKLPKSLKAIIEEKITWHFAGVDKVDMVGGSSPDCLDSLPLAGKKVLLSVGRLVPRKGYSQMLAILARNVVKDPDLVWLIVGDGPYKSTLQDEMRQLNLEKHVYFVGKVARNSLSHIYSFADAFWLYSKIEPFGLVYLEAATFDLPSLGPKAGGAQEAIKPETTGFYMDDEIDLSKVIEQCKLLKSSHKPSSYAESISTEKFASYLIK